MHGSVLYLVKSFICAEFSPHVWRNVSPEPDLTADRVYDDTVLRTIVRELAATQSLSEQTVLNKAGSYVVQQLMSAHRTLLAGLNTTFDIVANTEGTMHKMVRESSGSPPTISAHRITPTLMIVDYYSHRKLSDMAVGILYGIAEYCGEEIEVVPKTATDAERVQLHIILKKSRKD